MVDGKTTVDVGKAVEEGLWSAGTTVAFAGIEKLAGKAASKLKEEAKEIFNFGNTFDGIKNKITNSKLYNWFNPGDDAIVLREKRSLMDIIKNRDPYRPKNYATNINDVNRRITQLSTWINSNNTLKHGNKNLNAWTNEFKAKSSQWVSMVKTYAMESLCVGSKNKVKDNLRDNLYMSNLKEDVDIDGHFNQFICEFV